MYKIIFLDLVQIARSPIFKEGPKTYFSKRCIELGGLALGLVLFVWKISNSNKLTVKVNFNRSQFAIILFKLFLCVNHNASSQFSSSDMIVEVVLVPFAWSDLRHMWYSYEEMKRSLYGLTFGGSTNFTSGYH